MFRYILVRTGFIFVVLIIILSINFLFLKLAPEYPPANEDQKNLWLVQQYEKGFKTLYVERNPEVVLALQENEIVRLTNQYFRNEDDQVRIYTPVPISDQYFLWASNIITDWDWGVSTRLSYNTPAFNLLKERMPVTLKLNFLALFVYIPFGFGLGILAALKKNKWQDNAISLGVMIFISIPSFVVMTVLLMLFGFELEWLPKSYPASYLTGWIQIKALILPVFGLSFGAIAGLTRLTRAEITEVLTSEFLLLARTKGLTRSQAIVRHAMRNSMVPLVPSIIGSFVGLLSGSVVIERIYRIPGTGSIYIDALTRNAYDYNVILVSTAFYTTIGLIAILLVDLSYGIVDPRIRMGARK
ncbi:MAG: ABC transporter permease [Bacilli bacterium]|nr:ABC transporter permease [Bacilli bacterium]